MMILQNIYKMTTVFVPFFLRHFILTVKASLLLKNVLISSMEKMAGTPLDNEPCIREHSDVLCSEISTTHI